MIIYLYFILFILHWTQTLLPVKLLLPLVFVTLLDHSSVLSKNPVMAICTSVHQLKVTYFNFFENEFSIFSIAINWLYVPQSVFLLWVSQPSQKSREVESRDIYWSYSGHDRIREDSVPKPGVLEVLIWKLERTEARKLSTAESHNLICSFISENICKHLKHNQHFISKSLKFKIDSRLREKRSQVLRIIKILAVASFSTLSVFLIFCPWNSFDINIWNLGW